MQVSFTSEQVAKACQGVVPDSDLQELGKITDPWSAYKLAIGILYRERLPEEPADFLASSGIVLFV